MNKMNKKINFYVIGGQYAPCCHGGANTLLGAKRLAGKSDEYWDNWQGWHRPEIYRAEDCTTADTFYGADEIVPKDLAEPVAVYDRADRRWYDPTTGERV